MSGQLNDDQQFRSQNIISLEYSLRKLKPNLSFYFNDDANPWLKYFNEKHVSSISKYIIRLSFYGRNVWPSITKIKTFLQLCKYKYIRRADNPLYLTGR